MVVKLCSVLELFDMASFNQSPLGQTSVALQEISLGIGTDISSTPILYNVIKYQFNATDTNKVALFPDYQIIPSWRRSSRNIP